MNPTDNRIAAASRRLMAKLGRTPKPAPVPRGDSPAPLPVTGPLRAFRAAALWAIAVVVAVATVAAFTESYRGLFEWGEGHGLSGFWAAVFPLQVDLFIVVGELVLFVAMLDRWGRRDRAGAWAVALLGLAVSVSGNIGHVHAHDLQTRGTAAVAPVAAFGALWLGLGVLKRILRKRREAAAVAARSASAAAERDDLARVLDELTGAVLLLAGKAAEPVQPGDHIALLAGRVAGQHDVLADMVTAVRELTARPADAVPAPVPADAEDAALIAMKATLAAGNPLSGRQLETRFGLTRAQAAKVRETAGAEPIRYAAMNGSAAGA